jgi:hypothetical protein
MRIGHQAVSTVMAVAIVGVVGAGIADASSGGALLLGKTNKASGTTTLKASGVPLALKGPKSKPPLIVGSKKLVPHLNAQYLGGKTAVQLQPKSVELVGQFSNFGGYLKCPSGTHPAGGGVLPDSGSADDSPFVAVSFPHVAKNSLDGWEGIAADADGTYAGSGFVYVDCVSGPLTSSGSLSGKAVERQHAQILARARATHRAESR